MLEPITTLPRIVRRFAFLGIDVIGVLLALWLAYFVRFENPWPAFLVWNAWMFPLAAAISVPVFVGLGFYRSFVRFIHGGTFYGILRGVTLSVLLMLAIVMLVSPVPPVPRSIWFLYWLLAILILSAIRLVGGSYLKNRRQRYFAGARVLIYGAGDAGIQLAMALQHSREFHPVAFVDDNPELRGAEMFGLKVYAGADLQRALRRHRAETVLLAMPSAARSVRKRVIESLETLPVHVMAMPGLTEIVNGERKVNEIREVQVEDVLGRDPVPPDKELLSACIRDNTVLVTGAGGSIGGELCRQILRQRPRRLILLDHSEYALYSIDQDIRARRTGADGGVEVVPILASVQDGARMRSVIGAYRVDTVYHAAAYKHVPVVEHNPIEGIRNNVLGTWEVARAAAEKGVGTFVLVSTDKAVRPTNVMGASKRMAELILQGIAQTSTSTRFAMVRFGNVLASSGSVVPLFRKQIRLGGPITVTHPEVTRYFMTIPEAVQLVIQAGALADTGDVLVLNMGQPIKILDLARRMIHLSGFTILDEEDPEGDIEIVYTGLRPGEKLFEELLIGSDSSSTKHPMILRAREEFLVWSEIQKIVATLAAAVDRMDCDAARGILKQAVPGYRPENEIEDWVWQQSQSTDPSVLVPERVH